MVERQQDGSAGDADYGTIGRDYSVYRQPEPLIASLIHAALGRARTVLNLGAGAEKLPFPDRHFDASMATFSVHQWTDLNAGLAEMRRVTRGPVIILSCDPDLVQRFWLNAYAPEVLAAEAVRYPALDRLGRGLGGHSDIHRVPIPLHCRDGFNEAYYGRPERLLEDGARLACSAWSFVSPETATRSVDYLRRDIESGIWDRHYGYLRAMPTFDGSLRLIVSNA